MADKHTTSQYDELVGRAGVDGSTPAEYKKSAKVQAKIRLIEASKKFREKGNWDNRWSDFISIYANKYPYDELAEYEDVVVPNMVFSTVNVIVPSIAVNTPKINVGPVHPDFIEAAKVAEALVNHQWRVADVQEQVRMAIKDFVIIGHGWVKTTWDSQEEEVDLTAEEFEALATEALMTKRMEEQAGSGAELPSDDELIDAVPTKRLQLVVDDPLVRRISPFDMFVDPDAKDFHSLRWIAQRVFMPLDVAKANENWSKKARNKLAPVQKSKQRDEVTVEPNEVYEEPDGQEFVEIYEYYDLVSGSMCVFAEGCSEWLLEPTESPYPEIHPYTFIANYEVPERFYPVGDVETIFPLQLELGMTRTAQVNDRKRGRRITLYREKALGAQGVQDLKAGKDNVTIPVLQDQPFSEVFQQIQPLGLPPEWYRADQQALSDINLVSGVSEYQRGGQGDIRRTATEVGLMQDASNARSSDKLAKVERAMGQVAQNMIKLSQQFLEKQDVARVVSASAAAEWVPYSGEAIQGEFLFTVEAGSTQPQNESFRRQQAMQMMDTFGEFIGSGLLQDQEFLMEIMRMVGISEPERLMGPGLPPPPGPEAGPEAGPGAVPEEGGLMPPEAGMPPI